MKQSQAIIKCPVHQTSLQQDRCYGMDVWYCPECDIYYAERQSTHIVPNVTLHNKPVVFLEKIDKITEPEQPQKQQVQTKDIFSQRYEQLPNASELLICPIHCKLLETKTAKLIYKSNDSVTTTIGFCNHCNTIYTNSKEVALRGDTTFFGKCVTWSPIQLQSTMKLKPDMVVEPNITINIHTNEITIIRTKYDIKGSPKLIANAIAQVPIKQDMHVNVRGYYVASHRKFYTTPEYFVAKILPEECSCLKIIDQQNALKTYQHRPDGKKKAHEVQQLRVHTDDEQKRIQQTLQQVFYTQPLLKGDDTHCPFCNKKLSNTKRLIAIVYTDKVATGKYNTPCLFCKRCQVPFLSLPQEISVLNAIRPRMIYVFDARTCTNGQELLQKATQKYIKRPTEKKVTPQLPFEGELEEGKPLPNLSFDAKETKVLVYANNCHCSICQKKYQQNTIRNRTALVKTISGKTIKVNVEFCAGCGRYFMNITSFQQYCKRYGTILIECMMEHNLIAHNEAWFYFAPDTILSRCGYSVKQGIPQTHRQAVLAYILDSGKANKYEVLEIISRFIRMRKNYQPGACARWREDIEFVNQYNIQSQETVEGLTFQQAGPYRP